MLQNINLIPTREKLLLRFLGISPKEVFNNSQSPPHDNGGLTIVSRLKKTVDSFQSQAISSDGKTVDYTTLANSMIYQEFQTYLTPQLRNFDPARLKSNFEKLTFWINLYNVLVIDSVIRLSVQSSVTEGFVGVLRFFRQAAYDIGGHRTSLEDIEHGILRENHGNPFIPGGQFGIDDPRRDWIVAPMDPRVHFALNCASISCPPIEVYTPEQIDTQLDIATRNFINQEVSFESESNTLTLSRIFSWFADDFGGKTGVLRFLEDYLPREESRMIAEEPEKIHIRYHPYDWGLNRR